MSRVLPKLLVVGMLVLAAAVIIPLLRAKRAFAPHTPLVLGSPAPRPSMRRRVGGRRPVAPRQDFAAKAALPQEQAPALARGDSPALQKASRDVPVPRRGRRVEIAHADAGPRVVSTHSAAATPPTFDVPADLTPPGPPRALPRPAPSDTLVATTDSKLSSHAAEDVPAPPPRILTC